MVTGKNIGTLYFGVKNMGFLRYFNSYASYDNITTFKDAQHCLRWSQQPSTGHSSVPNEHKLMRR